MVINLKKIAIVVIAAITMSVTAVAQQRGDKAVGGNLVNENVSVGMGAKFFYNVTDPIRVAGEFDYFVKKIYDSYWDASAYFHYLFPLASQVNLYPSVGVGVVGSNWSNSYYSFSDINFVLSLGGGIDYELSSNLLLNGEVRVKMYKGYSNFLDNSLNFAIGLAYKF